MQKSYVDASSYPILNETKSDVENLHDSPGKGNSRHSPTSTAALTVAQPSPELLRSRLQFIERRMTFVYNTPKEIVVDTKRLLVRSLFLLLLEYILYLVFQLISYFTLQNFWQRSRFIPGVILGIVDAMVMTLMVVLINKKHKMLLFVLKLVQIATTFFLLGYLVAWDFGAMSLSYIIIVDIIILYLTVG